ncbi:helix-turn-helix domain-containing protein [Nocardia crassostreae]|uniref:helix-turn-helix domain-containing protein n=1 Tax=Nocardia crassostreae TaxID=53428 RepID=UPI001FDFEB64|nr:helix-turn-helix domain-containing protein [Nocardia crassostreae]
MTEISTATALSATSDEPVAVADSPASPPTRRVVQAIELLSRHPVENLSLARIIRGTGMSRATAHAVLSQLTADGWTIRDEDGNYGLGLGLLAVSRRAEAAFPLRRVALDAMRELSAAHGIPVFLAERDADSILITEVLGKPSVPWIRLGRHLPLAPPVAREFIAWAPDSERRAWLDAADPAQRPRLESVLSAIRTRGYTVERLADDSGPMIEALAALRHSPVTNPLRHRLSALITDLITIDYLPTELTDHNAVVSVAAPLFTGPRVTASIVACPDTNLTAPALESLAADVISAAHSIPN